MQNDPTINTRYPRACGQYKTADCTNTNTSLKHALAQVHEQTKCKGKQTPDGCIGASASQTTAEHEGTLTKVNALVRVHNTSYRTKMLFVANSVKLHSTANYCMENT